MMIATARMAARVRKLCKALVFLTLALNRTEMSRRGVPEYAIPPDDLPASLYDSWFAYAHDFSA